MLEIEILHYGYIFVFLGVIFEGDATLLTASFLARRGYFPLLIILAIAAIATTAANQLYFEFARRRGPDFFSVYPDAAKRVEKVYGWLPKYGGPLVLASRYLFGFRTLVPLACGASGMNRWLFAVWNISGAVLWTASVGLAGYFGAHVLTSLLEEIHQHEIFVAVGITTCALLLSGWLARGRDWFDFWNFRRHARTKPQ